jgi:glyoxylase-like metal-dependent hydrolase (beta-lactamase superfamily II)
MTQATVQTFFDVATCTATHVVACPITRQAAIIDSVLDFDAASARTATKQAQRVVAWVQAQGLSVAWHLETHVHADHLSAAPWLQAQLGGLIAVGEHIQAVQQDVKQRFNLDAMRTDGRPFDRLLADGETFSLGPLTVRVMDTPGHTPACVTYVVGDDAFIGDTLFMPDQGSARCDFPGGDARQLYQSVRKVLALPPHTRLHLCHDYAAGGRAHAWQTTVAAQRAGNVHLNEAVDEAAFVTMRVARDRTLGTPALMLPAIQLNAQAGHLPAPEPNGTRYLKIPLNLL